MCSLLCLVHLLSAFAELRRIDACTSCYKQVLRAHIVTRRSCTRCHAQAMYTLSHAGPEGTPYAFGCFAFDLFFPSTYPETAMLVNFETTGQVRFSAQNV